MVGHLNKTRRLVLISIFMAVIMVQTWVPGLGNIPLPGLSITYIHVTVIVAALLFDWKMATLIGFVWGLNSWLRAVLAAPNPMYTLVFISPLVSVIPRVLMATGTWLASRLLLRFKLKAFFHDSIVGVIGAVLNTAFVLGAIGLFKAGEFTSIKGADTSQVWLLLGAIIVTNAIPEIVVAAILTPTLARVLRPFKQQQLD